jgi:hypothetical protein
VVIQYFLLIDYKYGAAGVNGKNIDQIFDYMHELLAYSIADTNKIISEAEE